MKNRFAASEYKIFFLLLSVLVTLPLLSAMGKITENQKTGTTKDHTQTAAPKHKRIGIIGAGSLGSTVGKLLVKAGYEVMFSSRHPDELRKMVTKLGPLASVGNPKQAAAFGQLVLISVPFEAVPQVTSDLKQELKGKIVLDATNPWYSKSDLAREAEKNGIAKTTSKYFTGTRLVRVFTAVDATVLESSASQNSNKIGVPIAGDDKEVVEVAAQIVRDAGSEPVIVGDLASSVKFDPGHTGFRAHKSATELRKLLGLPAQE